MGEITVPVLCYVSAAEVAEWFNNSEAARNVLMGVPVRRGNGEWCRFVSGPQCAYWEGEIFGEQYVEANVQRNINVMDEERERVLGALAGEQRAAAHAHAYWQPC
eukprot:3061805-Alexandrium_andersonii.AAC.1